MNKNKQIKIDLIPGIKEIGLPVIEIEIGGNTHLFILDSGSTMNLVTCALKDSYPYSDIGAGKSYGIGGTVEERSIVSMIYSLDGVSHESEFMVANSSTFDILRAESNLNVEGIMGIPFLVQHECVVDFRKGKLLMNT